MEADGTEVIIITAGTTVVTTQHNHLVVTTGSDLKQDSKATQPLPEGLIFEMDVFKAIHSHRPLVPAVFLFCSGQPGHINVY